MKRFFQHRDIHDLFTLGDEYNTNSPDPASLLQDPEFAALERDMPGGEPTGDGGGADGAEAGPSSRGSPQDALNEGMRKKRESEGQEEKEEEKGDVKLLKQLLDGENIASAVNHDKVMGDHKTERDVALHQAAQIARAAAEALRRSQQECLQNPAHRLTWTGKSGSSGAPRFGQKVNPRMQHALHASNCSPGTGPGLQAGLGGGEVLSSKALISQIAQRHKAAAHSSDGGAGGEEPALDPAAPEAQRGLALMGQIVSFLNQAGTGVKSDILVQHFHGKIAPQDATLFRGLLKEVANLKRQGTRSRWVLKPDFRVAADSAAGV